LKLFLIPLFLAILVGIIMFLPLVRDNSAAEQCARERLPCPLFSPAYWSITRYYYGVGGGSNSAEYTVIGGYNALVGGLMVLALLLSTVAMARFDRSKKTV
jgi:hypothetical protein